MNMDTRLRANPPNLFEAFVEIARPTESTEEPFIIQKFPEYYDDEGTLKVLPRFAFPCDLEGTTVDHFTFVLTDIDSKFRFCFCRHATGAQTGLCIVSCLPWFEIFYKLLNYLAELTNRSDSTCVLSLLQCFYKYDVPTEPGQLCDIITPNFNEKFSFTTPNPQNLPTIPDNRNLTEYYNAVDTNNMMIIFASMLYERRILIVSKKLSRLTACVHASAQLLYPMFWQHLYIPVLPPHLLDYSSAPMPFLIGIQSGLLQKVRMSELGDAVILDADKNTIQTPYDDLTTLPADVVSSLKKRLRGHGSDRNFNTMVGDWLARSFLKAMVALIGTMVVSAHETVSNNKKTTGLISAKFSPGGMEVHLTEKGGYRDALRFRPGESISFDPDAFLQTRPPGMRQFLENTLQLQIFEQFINGRLEMLNAGKGFADEFEMENNMMGDKWGTRSRYKEWTNNMKKFQKGGKDRLAEFTGKVKDKSKKAYSNIRSKLDELRESPEKPASPLTGSPGAVKRGRPQTIPVSKLSPKRPPRPQNTSVVGSVPLSNNILNRRPTDPHSRHYRLVELETQMESHSPRISKRQSSDDSAVDMLYNRVSLDLMQDQDIQAVFKKSYSLEDLTMVSEEESTEGLNDQTPDTTSCQSLKLSTTASVGRPVPAPRTSLYRESSVPVLATTTNFLDQQFAKSTDNVCNNTTSRTLADNRAIYLKTNSSEDSLENMRLADVTSINCDDPPKLRSIVSRKPAFKSMSRPVSLIRDSSVPQATDALTINEARTAFMKTESIAKSLHSSGTSLEDFDPLVTGQVVVDDTSQSRTQANTGSDENLLKDWTGIDFTKRRQPPPPLPPKPALQPANQQPAGFVNMMASQYDAAYTSPTPGFPQMGVTARIQQPPHQTRPPLMKPLVSHTDAANHRPASMYGTRTLASQNPAYRIGTPSSQNPQNSAMYSSPATHNQSFLHTVRQTYTGPQSNLQIQKPLWPAGRTTLSSSTAGGQTGQDPFGDILNQVQSTPHSTTKTLPPMMKPVNKLLPNNPESVITQSDIHSSQPANPVQPAATKPNGSTGNWETFE